MKNVSYAGGNLRRQRDGFYFGEPGFTAPGRGWSNRSFNWKEEKMSFGHFFNLIAYAAGAQRGSDAAPL